MKSITKKEVKMAKRIIDSLVKHNFFEAIFWDYNKNGIFELRQWRCRYKSFLKENKLRVVDGASKICILSETLSNWVVKVSYTRTDDDGIDYCNIEAQNYRSAITEGLDQFFAATYKLCTMSPPKKFGCNRGITFFIQERADPDEERTSSICSSYMEGIGYSYDDDYNEDNDRIESLFYDSKRLGDIFDFINKWKINDLHSGNFGYTKNGEIKIIDYSGY